MNTVRHINALSSTTEWQKFSLCNVPCERAHEQEEDANVSCCGRATTGLDEMLVKLILILQGILNGKCLLCQIFLVILFHVGNRFCEFAK